MTASAETPRPRCYSNEEKRLADAWWSSLSITDSKAYCQQHLDVVIAYDYCRKSAHYRATLWDAMGQPEPEVNPYPVPAYKRP